MKYYSLLKFTIIYFLIVQNIQAQVGVNANGATPDGSAMMDIRSGNKGFLLPRLSLISSTDASTIPFPAKYLIVYNTNTGLINGLKGPGIYSNKGTTSAPIWEKDTAGPVGPTGPAGSSITYSSRWFTIPTPTRDSTIDGTCMKIKHFVAPQITADVLTNKNITVYFRIASQISQFKLPYISDAGQATNQLNCIFPKPGTVIIYRQTFNTCRFTDAIPQTYPGQPVLVGMSSSLEFRYVIN